MKPKQELNYDAHLDPQLVWAGKKEHSSFDVPTVSLHVHERIDPYTIIKAVRKKNGSGVPAQPSLFERPEEHRPMAGEDEGWARLARNLKAEINPELIEAYRGTKSLPFEAGDYKRVAVKVIDDRGIG